MDVFSGTGAQEDDVIDDLLKMNFSVLEPSEILRSSVLQQQF